MIRSRFYQRATDDRSSDRDKKGNGKDLLPL